MQTQVLPDLSRRATLPPPEGFRSHHRRDRLHAHRFFWQRVTRLAVAAFVIVTTGYLPVVSRGGTSGAIAVALATGLVLIVTLCEVGDLDRAIQDRQVDLIVGGGLLLGSVAVTLTKTDTVNGSSSLIPLFLVAGGSLVTFFGVRVIWRVRIPCLVLVLTLLLCATLPPTADPGLIMWLPMALVLGTVAVTSGGIRGLMKSRGRSLMVRSLGTVRGDVATVMATTAAILIVSLQ